MKIRKQFGDYHEIIAMILSDMPENGRCIWLTDRVVCSTEDPIQMKMHRKVASWDNGNDLSKEASVCTIDGVEWMVIETRIGTYLFTEDKAYFTTINL